MGYTIEISFDIFKDHKTSEIKNHITSLAIDYNCDNYFYFYEMEEGKKIPRNHCVIAVNFLEENILKLSEFVKEIKKIKNVHIESIYDDNILCKLIYASSYYLQIIDKKSVINYNKFKRERSYSDNENMIIKEIIKVK